MSRPLITAREKLTDNSAEIHRLEAELPRLRDELGHELAFGSEADAKKLEQTVTDSERKLSRLRLQSEPLRLNLLIEQRDELQVALKNSVEESERLHTAAQSKKALAEEAVRKACVAEDERVVAVNAWLSADGLRSAAARVLGRFLEENATALELAEQRGKKIA